MTEQQEPDPWLTYAQAAQIVGVNHQTIRLAAKRGDLAVSRLSRRLVRIQRSALDAWMRAGEARPTVDQ